MKKNIPYPEKFHQNIFSFDDRIKFTINSQDDFVRVYHKNKYIFKIHRNELHYIANWIGPSEN